ncbi:restriction endonuclease [Pseudomonas sp. B33.4]|uniref:restriction endonuclease n=1 Tax=Pseudomonas sp. B33.4 TaxID=3104265 RepID=UPI002ADEC27D|nr:restriction endonuclease [Pseudomonas sp. B33.4]
MERRGTAGHPDLQAFYRALASQKAKRVLFGLHRQATGFARSVERMVLADGNRLVNLMMDHEVGMSTRQIKLL